MQSVKIECPKCNKSDETDRYFYGILSNPRDMFKENAKRPEGIYGGDIIYEGYSPDFHCHRCTYDWRTDGNECGF